MRHCGVTQAQIPLFGKQLVNCRHGRIYLACYSDLISPPAPRSPFCLSVYMCSSVRTGDWL